MKELQVGDRVERTGFAGSIPVGTRGIVVEVHTDWIRIEWNSRVSNLPPQKYMRPCDMIKLVQGTSMPSWMDLE